MGWIRRLGWLLVAFGLTPPAWAEVIVRVEIARSGSPLMVGTSTPAQMLDSHDQPLGQLPPMQAIQVDPTPQGIRLGQDPVTAPVVRIRPEEDGLVAVEGRWYPGEVILAGYGTILAVNYVELESYVAGVVEFEMGSSFHPEALKAQAVAARSYVLYHRNSRPWFDVHSDTRSQVYRGLERLSPLVWEATQATRGMVLTYDNQFINAMYSSSSGGHTVGVEGVPYLQGFPDVTQRPRFGHGIGMSQWGAQDLASQGWSFNQILGYYYRGVGLARLP